MATTSEVIRREVERDLAGQCGWSEDRIDAELPVLFTDAEWEVMYNDPAFGYVCSRGHRQSDADRRWGACLSCDAEAEAWGAEYEWEALPQSEKDRITAEAAAWEAERAAAEAAALGAEDDIPF